MPDGDNSFKYAGIILAAGASRRMGVPKLLLPLGSGSLLINAVGVLAELMPTFVVTGAYPIETENHLQNFQDRLTEEGFAPLRFVYNPGWKTGMAGSIAVGVKAAAAVNASAYFIIVADQPGLSAEHTFEYRDVFGRNPTKIIATHYPEGPGVPAIFPARFREQLLTNRGQAGAKRILREFPEEVIVVRENHPPFFDIDTPEDYEQFMGRPLE